MKTIITFFVCLWLTLFFFFDMKPKGYGVGLALFKAAHKQLLTSDPRCVDGLNDAGQYEICINNRSL